MRLGDILKARMRGREGSEGWGEGAAKCSAMVQEIALRDIDANPFQPRAVFEEEGIEELAESLQSHGVLQPVVVRRVGARYQLVVGERRVRAARHLGWETIPAIVQDVDDRTSAELALIENLQRQDLDYLEEAEGYHRLLTEFGMTQEDLARELGKSQSTIANKLRLLKLSPRVRENISREIISERHCRALLGLESEAEQLKVLGIIKEKGLTVKETEELVERMRRGGRESRQRVERLCGDVQLLQKGIRKLVKEMRAGGARVELEEKEKEGVLEITIRIEEGK